MTGLISNRQELEHEIQLVTEKGRHYRDNIIITKYCDTKDHEGIYRKYGAYFIGGKIIRCHAFFNDTWIVKEPGFKEEKFLREEMDYIQSSVHEEAIRKAFELTRIDYGCIDCGMLDGKMQVWEINTHSDMEPITEKDGPRLQVDNYRNGEYIKALADIDLPSRATFRPRFNHLNKSFSRRLLQKAGKLLKRV